MCQPATLILLLFVVASWQVSSSLDVATQLPCGLCWSWSCSLFRTAKPCWFAADVSLQSASADLVRVDLSSAKAWRLTNANNSINLPTTVPAHTLSVLSSAGVIAADPLSRSVPFLTQAGAVYGHPPCSPSSICGHQSAAERMRMGHVAATVCTLTGPYPLAPAGMASLTPAGSGRSAGTSHCYGPARGMKCWQAAARCCWCCTASTPTQPWC